MKHVKYRIGTVLPPLFFILGIYLMLLTVKNNGLIILSQANHPEQVFYWLAPRFAVIQTGNLILLWGAFVACITGAFFCADRNRLIQSFVKVLLTNALCVLCATIACFVFEGAMFPKSVEGTSSVFLHSLEMLIGMYGFLVFWSLFGLGLSKTFKSKFIASILGIALQIIELSIVFRYAPQMEIYLPTGISRDLIVNQFPFWDNSSWAAVKGAFAFASTPLTVDSTYHFINVGRAWILIFLVWFLLLAYIVPIGRWIANRSETR